LLAHHRPDRENVGAQRFYQMLGVPQNPAKLFYRLEGEALRRAAGSRGGEG
jgi:hypothetical protein